MIVEIFSGKEYKKTEDVRLKKGQKFCITKGKKRVRSISYMNEGTLLKCRLFGEKRIRLLRPQRYDGKGGSCIQEKRAVEIYRTKWGPDNISIFIDGRNYKYTIKKWR